jgi:hypothetical protein
MRFGTPELFDRQAALTDGLASSALATGIAVLQLDLGLGLTLLFLLEDLLIALLILQGERLTSANRMARA